MFITALESLKNDLSMLKTDKFSSSYRRINQPNAARLLGEIEDLENENKRLKEKLEQINRLSCSDV